MTAEEGNAKPERRYALITNPGDVTPQEQHAPADRTEEGTDTIRHLLKRACDGGQEGHRGARIATVWVILSPKNERTDKAPPRPGLLRSEGVEHREGLEG